MVVIYTIGQIYLQAESRTLREPNRLMYTVGSQAEAGAASIRSTVDGPDALGVIPKQMAIPDPDIHLTRAR
jgi:hypothetical protein